MDGTHAFLSAYHGSEQQGRLFFVLYDVANHTSGLETSPLNLTSGSIWTALNIDYPGHSFAELGIFHGDLPQKTCLQIKPDSLQRV